MTKDNMPLGVSSCDVSKDFERLSRVMSNLVRYAKKLCVCVYTCVLLVKIYMASQNT